MATYVFVWSRDNGFVRLERRENEFSEVGADTLKLVGLLAHLRKFNVFEVVSYPVTQQTGKRVISGSNLSEAQKAEYLALYETRGILDGTKYEFDEAYTKPVVDKPGAPSVVPVIHFVDP